MSMNYTNYIEEQFDEVQALDSIYCTEFEVLGIDPRHRFVIPIKSEDYEPDSGNGHACKLKFTYTPNYPDEAPEVEVIEEENLDEDDINLLKEHIIDVANENLGMVMVFTLVSSGQEWLNNKWDETRKKKEENAKKKEIEQEEAERKRFEGTRVTVESFLAWKARFDEEFGHNKKLEKEESIAKKLTGRELFLTDKTLNESDLKFLEDGGDAVKVDESLFQELDELDLEGEDDLDDYS